MSYRNAFLHRVRSNSATFCPEAVAPTTSHGQHLQYFEGIWYCQKCGSVDAESTGGGLRGPCITPEGHSASCRVFAKSLSSNDIALVWACTGKSR